MTMNKLVKPALVLGFVSAVALAAVTPSEARSGRNALAIGAGIAGLAVGAAVASSAANNYYGYYGPYYRAPAYGYYQEPYVAYDSYAYAPRYRRYNPDPSAYYEPAAPTYYYQYENSYERQLRGADY
jgi:hypothetical protein